MISSDLLVRGTPAVAVNGTPTFVGTLDGGGEVSPSDYSVVLNSGAVLRHLVRRVNPISLPTVSAPVASAGTRDVSLNHGAESAGDFATLRNLTLNANAGIRAVPAGNYGVFIANGSSGFAASRLCA